MILENLANLEKKETKVKEFTQSICFSQPRGNHLFAKNSIFAGKTQIEYSPKICFIYLLFSFHKNNLILRFIYSTKCA